MEMYIYPLGMLLAEHGNPQLLPDLLVLTNAALGGGPLSIRWCPPLTASRWLQLPTVAAVKNVLGALTMCLHTLRGHGWPPITSSMCRLRAGTRRRVAHWGLFATNEKQQLWLA